MPIIPVNRCPACGASAAACEVRNEYTPAGPCCSECSHPDQREEHER